MSEETFDVIVTGAGSAGAVVVARLSENGRHSVPLPEAGPADSNPWIHIPLGFSRTYIDPVVIWKFESDNSIRRSGTPGMRESRARPSSAGDAASRSAGR
jgi:choline dehydrogenase